MVVHFVQLKLNRDPKDALNYKHRDHAKLFGSFVFVDDVDQKAIEKVENGRKYGLYEV
jgi:hypothetical protein